MTVISTGSGHPQRRIYRYDIDDCRCLEDLDGSGVGVTLVCPAYVQTRLMETFRSPDLRHRQMAERWMARSAIRAEDVADKVFNAVGAADFLVMTHAETNWMWRMKRWFPGRFHRTMLKFARKMKGRAAA